MIKTLPDILENSSRLFPNNEAFRCGDQYLTYEDLNFKTSQLANHLIRSGVKKGDRVGIYMNRCIETVVAVYGILKSGAAYVPLDSTAPHARTLFLLNDCGIRFLVTTPKQSTRILKVLEEDSPIKQIIGLSEDIGHVSWTTIYKNSLESYKNLKISGQDLAYIMYTSGSTGTPKGIMHTHSSALTYAELSANLYGLNSKDRVGNHAPLHFDISTFGYFSAPYAGATTVIIPDAHTKFPVSLAKLIEAEKLTVWYSVPLALIQLWLSGALKNHNLQSLRWVLFGGENFTIKYLRALMQCWPNSKFSNVYGPAEVNQCTYHNLEHIPDLEEQIPIGKVWDKTEYKILNKKDEEVSYGESGELVIKSSTMMLGYWNNQNLTNDSLYKEKSSSNVEHVYFRTGDLVKQNSNGDFLFLGRTDRQVKIRGHRIEIDEIEAVLTGYKEVKAAAVCVIENENNDKKIIAAVLSTSNSKLDTLELMDFCKKHLPTYSVPHRINVLKQFPRTSSGKTDLTAIKKNLIAL